MQGAVRSRFVRHIEVAHRDQAQQACWGKEGVQSIAAPSACGPRCDVTMSRRGTTKEATFAGSLRRTRSCARAQSRALPATGAASRSFRTFGSATKTVAHVAASALIPVGSQDAGRRRGLGPSVPWSRHCGRVRLCHHGGPRTPFHLPLVPLSCSLSCAFGGDRRRSGF